MNQSDVQAYYSRHDIQEFLLKISKNREVVGVLRDKKFLTRPNVLLYPKDIEAMVKTGAVAFHGSIERWSNPMALKQDNYSQLRKGFDLILDLDCTSFEQGKIAAKVFLWGLQKHGIKNHYLKFTGGKGFHIGIPWEAFPKAIDYKPTESLFPDMARDVGLYLKEFLRDKFERELLKAGSPEELAKQAGKPLGEIVGRDVIDPYKLVDVDPVLISPRHLFRLPYSLHEGTFLVSLPLKLSELEDFRKKDAAPGKVKVSRGFLEKAEENEAGSLILGTLEWVQRLTEKQKEMIVREKFKIMQERGYNVKYEQIERLFFKEKIRERHRIGRAVQPRFFPPCIHNILKGMQDGKKRSLFVMTNFLSTLGWKHEDIEDLLQEWNEKNDPKLRENYIRTHVRWHRGRKKLQKEALLPPNCKKDGYYQDMGICTPDALCGLAKKTIKNPVNYALAKLKEDQPKKRRTRPVYYE